MEKSLVAIACFASVVVVIIAILNFILRLRILSSGHKDEEYVKLLRSAFDFKSSALKWGLLFLFGGIGLFIVGYVPYYPAPFPFAVESVCIAFAFLLYYFITVKQRQ
ncbi:hypothetical protein MUY27_11170 [Mucilaginibacter sp. RS28]|uniref:DUF3784 domain-containing protein n=1 Tax=Mucilaginibacter straminoryzae TaxID=2932774 RepID=A0A9X2B956_9SPHI|nr:hypothetical protein [Mucilaginibacter straminoryzae]MCJ8210269.1 hypothetical protein [Mucilaginibacter straminoryzae]